MKSNTILVGRFGAPHGVKGALKLFSYTNTPEGIFDYPLKTKEGREFQIDLLHCRGDCFVVNVQGISSPEEARKLTNLEVFTDRSNLPGTQGQEIYHADLIGLDVISAGQKVGSITNVYNFGAGDIVEIEDASGKKDLISFEADLFTDINLTDATIQFHKPETVEIK